MIVIDGQQTGLNIKTFNNLEQLLVKVMEDNYLENRVVTDVLVNQENFSEIYPHQAEDVAVAGISTVEIKSVPVTEMAVSIIEELFKVLKIMKAGARQVADLFRQADDSEALELYQDVIDVTRDFLGMVSVLRDEFAYSDDEQLGERIEELSELFSEMIEVAENEDWILLSDLLEYEYRPSVERWDEVLTTLRREVSASAS